MKRRQGQVGKASKVVTLFGSISAAARDEIKD